VQRLTAHVNPCARAAGNGQLNLSHLNSCLPNFLVPQTKCLVAPEGEMQFPVGSFPGAPRLETRKALVLIDLQNDFINPTGKLHVKNVADFVPRLPGLISKFRESGEIVWVQTQFIEPRPTISPELGSYTVVLKDFVPVAEEDSFNEETSPADDDAALDLDPGAEDPEAFLAPRNPGNDDIARCCLTGTIGSRLSNFLASFINHENDVVLVKSHYSAFANTPILLNLRKKFVSELYLCGSLSNISVYATALDAVRHGLNVTIIEDCVGYRDETCHQEAMRQMADGMGAEGVELQELVDDLNGDLGDVVTDDTFPTRFEVSLSNPNRSSGMPQGKPRLQGWMSKVDCLLSTDDHPVIESIESHPNQARHASNPSLESSPTSNNRAITSTRTVDESQFVTEPPVPQTDVLLGSTPSSVSPPRKRSTDLDFEQQERKAIFASSRYRLSEEPAIPVSKHPKPKTNRIRVRKRKPKGDVVAPRESETSVSSAPPSGNDGEPTLGVGTACHSMPQLGNIDDAVIKAEASVQSKSASSLSTSDDVGSEKQLNSTDAPATAQPTESSPSAGEAPGYSAPEQQHAGSITSAITSLGEGDSRICHNLLASQHATAAFHALRWTVQWQKMYHRSGEVPRLVAVQGDVHADGSIPIYRHPADESPELRPFSSTVQRLRECVEKALKHPVNHVLIQLYRSGEDNISEHSDKTLDIVPGSDIVNVSLGAQRTMVLRAKKSSDPAAAEIGAPRLAQRIPLPHNSMFILGQKTNQQWLHAIRADKRREAEKSPEELDFGGERISLTFRYIGTFINPVEGTIWGQGATEKEKQAAKKMLCGPEAERAGEAMIQAFGLENHLSNDFDWGAVYGKGFDVVNFTTKVVVKD
jgi:nicotinamidase-related amidase/alkylated DNA repair dioxygenase AlkB